MPCPCGGSPDTETKGRPAPDDVACASYINVYKALDFGTQTERGASEGLASDAGDPPGASE